jgi:hypothetical protein
VCVYGTRSAVELDVDALCDKDGNVVVAGIMEHIEQVSICVVLVYRVYMCISVYGTYGIMEHIEQVPARGGARLGWVCGR